LRRTSLAAGVLYLLTFVSIPTLALYKPVKDDVGSFIQGTGGSSGILWAGLSEVVVGLAGIGTAVVLYPVARRVSQTAALGFVAARVVEGSLIIVGVTSMLTILTLRTEAAGLTGTEAMSFVAAGHGLVAQYNWTFLLSQSLLPVFNDLLLGYVLYRARLVPRVLPLVAFIGAPLLLASDVAVYFGAYPNVSPIAALAALPVALFELSLGIWLIVKGLKPTPVGAGERGDDLHSARSPEQAE
jgi:hypothetical protein